MSVRGHEWAGGWVRWSTQVGGHRRTSGRRRGRGAVHEVVIVMVLVAINVASVKIKKMKKI